MDMTCFLCFQRTSSIFNIFEGPRECFSALDIPKIIEKYVYFKPERSNPMLCNECWTTIESFYTFCLRIEKTQRNWLNIKNETDTDSNAELPANNIEIKLENNTYDSVILDCSIEIGKAYNLKRNALPDNKCEEKVCIYKNSSIEKNKLQLPICKGTGKFHNPHYDKKNLETKKNGKKGNIKINANTKKIIISKSNENELLKKSNLQLLDDVKQIVKCRETNLETKQNYNEENLTNINGEIEITKNSKNNENEKIPIKRKGLRVIYTPDDVDEKISKYITLSCEICNEIKSTLAELKNHYTVFHNKKGYATCCNKKFFKRYLLHDHIECHLNPEHFKCDLCDKTFAVADCLKKHIKVIHETGKQTFYCDMCPKKFARKPILDRHKDYHLPIETWKFSCIDCGKMFPSKYYLHSHKRMTHNTIPTKVCFICAKDVRTNRYKKHIETHNDNYEEEKVQCEICKAKLNKKYINIHRQHHKEAEKQEFFCTICKHQSPNRRALYIHMRYTHGEQRNHECQICHKAFKRKLVLTQHMGTHTGDNLYSCPYCPKTFTYDSNFYIHKKKEHPKEVEIEKQSKTRTNFLKHMDKINIKSITIENSV